MAADSKQLQLTSSSYDSCCRLCLRDNTGLLMDVFGGNMNSAGLIRRIANTLGIKMDSSDKITTSICLQCLQKVNNWNTYRKVCVANQTKLDNWMVISSNNVQIKEEPLDEQEESDIEIVESSEDSQTQQSEVSHQNGVTHRDDDLPPTLTPNRPNDDISIDNSLDATLDANDEAPALESTEITPRPPSIAESSKIEFAAGLCLQSKSLSPPSKQSLELTLTNLEESYIYKCKVIITIFHLNTCHCHNTVQRDVKRIVSHLRVSSPWFPPYTCYNCMITFNGRSAKMRHGKVCSRLRMENLIRLSELRGRDDNKLRLYHTYICTECTYTFAFFEDFCDHIYYDHLESDTQNHCTICKTTFDSFELLREHSFNSCFLVHHCDICYIKFDTKEDFRSHCAEKHDNEAQFNFFELCEGFTVLSNIDIANLLITARTAANTKQELDLVIKPEADVEVEVQVQVKVPNIKPPKKVKKKQKDPFINHKLQNAPQQDLEDSLIHSPTACISCDNSYSSYHNMIRHLKTAHKFSSLRMQNALICPDCGETHNNLHLLVKHRRNHPPADSDPNKTCLTCKETFESPTALRQHILTTHTALLNSIAANNPEPAEPSIANAAHKRKRMKSIGCLKCNECGDTFGRAHELESHRNTHLNIKLYRDADTHAYRSSLSSGEKEFKCRLCNQDFNTRGKLYSHMKLHRTINMPHLNAEVIVTGDVKPLVCKFCSVAFAKQREFFDHIDKEHNTSLMNESTKYPRECIFCNKSISKPGAYANHIMMHKRLIADVDFVTNSTATDPVEVEVDVDVEIDEKPTLNPDLNSNCESNDDGSDYHTCKRCFKVFSNRYSLKNHMKSHGITMKTPTRTSAKLNKSTKVYWCSICHQACQGEGEFKQHKLEHLAESKDQLTLTMPMLIVDDNVADDEEKPLVFYCEICSKYYSSKSALKKHKDKHEEALSQIAAPPIVVLNQKTGFYCKYCKISFSNHLVLAEHMGSIHDQYDAGAAAAVAKPPRKKQKHTSSFDTEQLYSCSICKKTFSTVGALQSHQGWHKRTKAGKYSTKCVLTPTTQFFCKPCQVGFNDDTSLQIHTLEVHRNVNATIIPLQPTLVLACVVCNLQFPSQIEMESHMMMHSVEQMDRKPHPCQYCDKCFSRSDTLAAHEKQYHAELILHREFKCHLCDRVFDRNNSLAIHLKMHAKSVKPAQSQMKVYSCSICQIGFHLPKDLRNHIITTHPF